MKKVFLALIIILIVFQGLFSQKKNVEKTLSDKTIFQLIDSLEQAGLAQSAFKLTDGLHQKAISEKNTTLFIKTLVLRMKYREDITEESLVVFVNELERQLPDLWEPAKHIAHSMLAELYQWYYAQNQWKILEQSQVESGSTNIRDMSASELSTMAIAHYKLSLDNPLFLQNELISQYKEILIPEFDKLHLRPTLFDFLSVRAVEAMLSDGLFQKPNVAHPVFEKPAILGDLDQFLKLSFTDAEADDAVLHGLGILQNWLAFRVKSPLREPLFDADLKRLVLLSSFYTGEDNEELYELALTNLAKKSRKTFVYSDVMYRKAMFLQQLSYSDEKDDRNYLKEAISIAQLGADAWPKSEGAVNCRSLIQNIKAPDLNLKTEEFYGIGEPFAYVVDYKNIERLYVSLFRLEPITEVDNRTYNSQEMVLKQLKNLKPIRTEKKQLPNFGDYLNHSAELDLQVPNEPGLFCLIATQSPFNGDVDKTELMAISVFQISNLSVFHKSGDDGFANVTVLDRISGNPVKNATLLIYGFSKYDGERKLKATQVTDEDGKANVLLPKNSTQLQVEAVLGNDKCQTRQLWFERSSDSSDNRSQSRMFLFTDRQIYRPGQTVWFKGILMETNGEKASVLKQQSVAVSFHDVNGQELSSQTLLTNDFGSINGSFTIPSNVLTGNFYIQTPHGNHNFSVENYKRPRFEVVMEPFKAVALLGDEVTTKGKAIAMTGEPLQSAKVSWRVTRQIRFWRHWGFQKPASIASGEGVTDENGAFTINFTGLPSSKKANQFPESFVVDVDITDVNGETRSQSQTILLGNDGIIPSLELKKSGFMASVKEVPVLFVLKNHSDEEVDGNVRYSVSKLVVPQHLFPNRAWEQPDTVLYKSSIYGDKLSNKNEWNNWTISEVVKNDSIKVVGRQSFKIDFDNDLAAGVYKIEMEVTDKNGQIRKEESSFYVVGSEGQAFNPGQGLVMTLSKTEAVPGNQIELSLASTFKQGRVLVVISHKNKTLFDLDIPVEKISEKIIIPVTLGMEGFVNIHALMVQNNRVYEQHEMVVVTDPARQMNLKWQSYRDKVRPASKELWRIKISNGNDEPTKAEMLALMYDSSLDYFAANQLQMNPFYFNYGYSSWQYDGFGLSYGRNHNLLEYASFQYAAYPTFNWFGYEYGRRGGRGRFGGPMMLKAGMTSDVLNIVDDDVTLEEEEIIPITRQAEVNPPPPPPIEPMGMVRRQLQETAFFMPSLLTDENGEVEFAFTMPESVAKWRFMAMAHSIDGVSGSLEQYITSSRELMVMPNLPRIVREGDELTLSTKIINTTDSVLIGTANLTIKNAVTGDVIDGLKPTNVSWQSPGNGTALASWYIKIPSGVNGLLVTVTAATEDFQDGEEHLIPVLPVKMVITESMPITLSGKGKHKVKLQSLVNSKQNEHAGFSFTYTQNVAWELLGVLPWLIERPYENSDQIFNRYFAVSVAKQIFKDHPQIERVLKAWAAALPGDENALLSALEKNPELKNTLLAATPWLTEAKNDTERRRRLASLVAEGYLDREQSSALSKLRNLQLSDGAWPWYGGMQPSEFITSDIVAGFGYLKKMGIDAGPEVENSNKRAIAWLQNQLVQSRDNALKNLNDQMKTDKDTVVVPDWNDVKNLYALSFFTSETPSEGELFWIKKLQKHTKPKDVTEQSMVALVLSRYGYELESQKLLLSIKEKAIKGERGEWFYKTVAGPYWHQAPVERQVVALEAIRELESANSMIPGMEDWLMSQKRTQHWNTSRATVSAVYALVTSQRRLFDVEKPDQIKVGGQVLKPSKTVSGSGYFSQSWSANEVKPALGNVEVKKNSDSPSWATMHWRYIEEEANVKQGGFMNVSKQVFKRMLNQGVEEWYPISDTVRLSTGDRLMVRLMIDAPQALDFVHVNDKRASVLEPLEVLSGYIWKAGLGYYSSVTDAGADFFIDHLPKGKYTLAYEMVVSHQGVATSGPAVVQCFYAPEFSGHSSGCTFTTNKD